MRQTVTKTAMLLMVAIVLASGLSAVTMTSASAGPTSTKFRSCHKLNAVFKHGVARSERAAARVYRAGAYRPKVRPNAYRLNRHLDANGDGTACGIYRPDTTPDPVPPAPLPVIPVPTVANIELTISPSYHLDGYPDYTYLQSPVCPDEHTLRCESTLLDAAGGVISVDDNWGDDLVLSLDPQLTIGATYTLTVTTETMQHWECSVYYRNGCMWTGGGKSTYRWTFTYQGISGQVVPTAEIL